MPSPTRTPGVEPTVAPRAAYRRCAGMLLRHDPTYFVAVGRLPRQSRGAIYALYGFLRGADEIVDAPGPHGPVERRAALERWQLALEEGSRSGRSAHPVIAALVHAAERHELPVERLPRYVQSMAVDCAPRVRITAEADLDAYMEGSAATVGRVVGPAIGVRGEAAERLAELGRAFQLTNFVRDVAEDWERDRVYLPGLDEADLHAGRPSRQTRDALAHHVHRARAMFAHGAGAEAHAPIGMRPGMRLARAVYERVLDHVVERDYAVLDAPGTPGGWRLAAAGVRGLRG